jgi:hypothetical protein
MDEIMALYDRLRRRRREGMYADLISRDDPRLIRYERDVTHLSSVDAPAGLTVTGPPVASITCPACGRTSYNPDDIREGYCGNCCSWTSSPDDA